MTRCRSRGRPPLGGRRRRRPRGLQPPAALLHPPPPLELRGIQAGRRRRRDPRAPHRRPSPLATAGRHHPTACSRLLSRPAPRRPPCARRLLHVRRRFLAAALRDTGTASFEGPIGTRCGKKPHRRGGHHHLRSPHTQRGACGRPLSADESLAIPLGTHCLLASQTGPCSLAISSPLPAVPPAPVPETAHLHPRPTRDSATLHADCRP